MTCREVQPLLSAYHDRELDAAARADVADHVAACPACQAQLIVQGQLSEVLRAGQRCEIPAGMWERIATNASRPRRRLRRRRWLVRGGAVAAGFGLYVLGHELVASSVPRGVVPSPPPAIQVEQVLRETALALAGRGLADDASGSLAHRSEVLLVQELTEDAQP